MQALKQIFVRGLMLTIPIMVIVYVLVKVIIMIARLVHPVATKLGIEQIAGELTLTILVVLLILIVVLIMGLLMRLAIVSNIHRSIESLVINLVPSLNQLKVMASESLKLTEVQDSWKPVILHHEDRYNAAFVVEEDEEMITLVTILGTTLTEGEILITQKSNVELIPVTYNELLLCSKSYGKGFLKLIKKGRS